MRSDIVPGGVFPDYALPDHTGTVRTLGELQGGDPLVLTLARGHHCPAASVPPRSWWSAPGKPRSLLRRPPRTPAGSRHPRSSTTSRSCIALAQRLKRIRGAIMAAADQQHQASQPFLSQAAPLDA